jgi:purine-binding chemotaxis protein CheW
MDISATTDLGSLSTIPATVLPSAHATSPSVASGLTPTEKLALLKARALEMARIPEATEPPTLQLDVTEFRFGEETYAFASTSVREVYSPKSITLVPCTPPFILGIMNVRGRILPVIDIKSLFGQPSPPRQAQDKVIIIHAAGMEVGLLADTIIGVRTISMSAIHPPLPTLAEPHSRYMRGLTNDGTMILDAALLLNGSRLGGNKAEADGMT